MTQDTNAPRRKDMRLQGYNYSQPGAYFVTLCTKNRLCLFGDVVNGQVLLSEEGRIAYDCWTDLPTHYTHIALDEFVVMPNHVHGIILIADAEKAISPNETRAGYKPAPTSRYSLSEVMRGFKTFSGRRINRLRNSTGQAVWQRNFYDHVIRDEKTLAAVREYIVNNPAKWSEDYYNPRNQLRPQP